MNEGMKAGMMITVVGFDTSQRTKKGSGLG